MAQKKKSCTREEEKERKVFPPSWAKGIWDSLFSFKVKLGKIQIKQNNGNGWNVEDTDFKDNLKNRTKKTLNKKN
jgi:hypothetical protein